MKYFLLFTLIIFALSSCSIKNKKSIFIFNDLYLELQDGESLQEIFSNVNNKYSKYFNNDTSFQMPLFRYITHHNYELFIGLPFKIDFENLAKQKKKKASEIFGNFKLNAESIFVSYSVDDLYLSEYTVKFVDGSIISIAAISSSKVFSDSLLNESNLSKRINKR